MAALKRKADHGGNSSKKHRDSPRDPAAKRRKSNAVAEPAPTKAKHAKPESKTIFQDEEKSFPRGGASLLTPLEHKQIQIKANQDVLFEQAGIKRTGNDALSDIGTDDGAQSAPKPPKKRHSKKSKKLHHEEEKEKLVRVEGLSYKKLLPGTIILGQVTAITHQDIVLALPNNLVGYVPLTAVSEQLNDRLEKLLKDDTEGKDEESDEAAFDDVDLEHIFFVGQYLRACVMSLNEETPLARKRLELSIDPKVVNKGLSRRRIPFNSTVQASVVSNEDHGLVMDLGLNDDKLKGFLPKGELDSRVQYEEIQEGTVFMCLVTGLNSDGHIVKLSADQSKAGNLTKGNTLLDAPTIDVFLPGTAVDLLVADTTSTTVTGKILGLIDATADAYHSGTTEKGVDVSKKYKIGSKVKGRILFTCPESDPTKVGISLLDHVVGLSTRMSGKPKERKSPLTILPISTILESAKVIKVQPGYGVFFDLGARDITGFAHISRLTDNTAGILSEDAGTYKLESKHRARIIGHNELDGLFQLSLEQKVLDQQFIRIEDIKVGQVVKGQVHKLIADKNGAPAVLVHLADGFTGLVPEMHLADVRLQHPERKFREGMLVTARVWYTDASQHQIQLTLKKSLVNSEAEPWTDYAMISEGATGPGLLVKVQKNGATVRFYGDVKAWLPVSEMSEAFIEDATRHFVAGQVVNVRVLSVNEEERRMIVSCKDPAAIDTNKEAAFNALNPGGVVKGTVTEKSEEAVFLDLGHGVKGVLRIGHLTDGSEKKDLSTMKKIRAGGTLEDLVVLTKHGKSRTVTVSNKPSLRKDAQASRLAISIEDLQAGEIVHGFVRGILPEKVFVELGNAISGAVFKSQLTEEMLLAPNFGLRKDQSVTVRVTHIDASKNFFWLSMKLEPDADEPIIPQASDAAGVALVNPIDSKISTTGDIKFGIEIEVRVRSVKDAQLNVELADKVYGRISVAEVFDSWDEIPDKKRPTAHFKMNDRFQARILGKHDARNHRFLPITQASKSSTPTYELTMKKHKPKTQTDVLSLDKISPDGSYVAFINNIADRYVWVNISANVRGRIDFFDLSDDLEQLSAIEENFPVGSALKVRVKAVDVAAGRLDLTAASTVTGKTLNLHDLKVGYILPARVTKLHDSSIVVQINDKIAAPIFLEHLADDYDKADPSSFKVGDVLRVCVIEIDLSNKKLGLSARPSRVLNSALPVKDIEITDRSQLNINQVVRGFVKRVAENGIYVRLGPHVEAFVLVSHLSDRYIKDWKAAFHVDQLVTGKIISNRDQIRIPQMSLKTSIVENEYVEAIEFGDLNVGQMVIAKVRHVENFGIFLVVENSNNVSGLCHISELADKSVKADKVNDMYQKDDVVKAKIIRIDPKKRRIGFTLKYSQVQGGAEDEDLQDAPEISDDEATDADTNDESDGEEAKIDEDVDMRSIKSVESDEEQPATDSDHSEADGDGVVPKTAALSLDTPGFDWTGATLDFDKQGGAISSDSDEETPKKRKKSKKPTIKEDRTGDLDAHGPQCVADYERLLLGQPNSAEIWVRYMIFQRALNEIEKARQIARRALATINPREEQEKLDMWTALLHLENDFAANDDAMEDVFKEACQHNDAREVHERMIKIYISSRKLEKADALYQSMMKNKSFTPDPHFWLSYATFLMDTLSPPSPSRARNLLQRATQSVTSSQHRYLTQKFAALEFKSAHGDAERGRTIFEGLVSTWPNKGDIWDVYVSLEMSHGTAEGVRSLFERMVKTGKSKRKASVFKKWIEWEDSVGNAKGVVRVKMLEEQWREDRKERKEKDSGE